MNLLLPDDGFQPASNEELAGQLRDYNTPLGRYLGAKVSEGWFNSVIGSVTRPEPSGNILERERVPGKPSLSGEHYLTQDEWKASPNYREGLPFRSFMTEADARIQTEIFDDKSYRDWIVGQRQNGVVGNVLGFGAAMVGGLPDPVNYIPLGLSARIALAAKASGYLGKRFAPAFLGNAAEAAIGTALTEPVIVESAKAWGDDFTWADIVTDIALGAATGGVIGVGVERLTGDVRDMRVGDKPQTGTRPDVNVSREATLGDLPDPEAGGARLMMDATQPIPERAAAQGADDLNIMVSDLVHNREPMPMSGTARLAPELVEAPVAKTTVEPTRPGDAAQMPTPEQAAAPVAEAAKPQAEGATSPAATVARSAEEDEVESLIKSGSVPKEIADEYGTVLAASEANELGIDAGYERALVCLRSGELD